MRPHLDPADIYLQCLAEVGMKKRVSISQDRRKQTHNSQAGIWSVYHRVPRQMSHLQHLTYNYCHSELSQHQAVYETHFCWNRDSASLIASKIRLPCSFRLLEKWLICRDELHEGVEERWKDRDMFTSWWTFSGLVLITSQSVDLMQFSSRQPAGNWVLQSCGP